MKTFAECITAGVVTPEEAFALYDSLPTADVQFMMGRWKGSGFPTGHPVDGVLEACHWYGKRFESPEDVHPLVFTTLTGGQVSINPALMPMGLLNMKKVPRSAAVGRLFQLLMPFFMTRRARARVRMTEYRGKVSATMIYDALPINDVFRKVDDDTLLGVMDYKGMADSLFFVLRREREAAVRSGGRIAPTLG